MAGIGHFSDICGIFSTEDPLHRREVSYNNTAGTGLLFFESTTPEKCAPQQGSITRSKVHRPSISFQFKSAYHVPCKKYYLLTSFLPRLFLNHLPLHSMWSSDKINKKYIQQNKNIFQKIIYIILFTIFSEWISKMLNIT